MSVQVLFATLHGDESSPLHCVIPFNHTSYIRYAPRTAHRPFPTVSLKRFVPFVIPTAASAEWRNPPRWIMNHHKIKSATWEDSSTRFRSLGMTCRRVVLVCPHRLYSKRGGRLIAAPTYATPLRPLFLQSRTPYRASSTAYGGSPSPKGEGLG